MNMDWIAPIITIVLIIGGVGGWIWTHPRVPPGLYPPGFGPTSELRGPPDTRYWVYAGRDGDCEVWIPLEKAYTQEEIREQQKYGRWL